MRPFGFYLGSILWSLTDSDLIWSPLAFWAAFVLLFRHFWLKIFQRLSLTPPVSPMGEDTHGHQTQQLFQWGTTLPAGFCFCAMSWGKNSGSHWTVVLYTTNVAGVWFLKVNWTNYVKLVVAQETSRVNWWFLFLQPYNRVPVWLVLFVFLVLWRSKLIKMNWSKVNSGKGRGISFSWELYCER